MRFHHNNSTGTTSSRRTKCHRGNILRGNCRRVMILGAVVVFTIASCLSMFNAQAPTAYARDYDAEIKALQNQIDDYNKRASELSAQADTLQGKINELQNQQASIQAQIDLSEAEKAQLEQQIADAEAKIKAQAAALGETLKTQYYSNQTSALDILMNSDSVSDYVDRQTRQQSMSDQITETVNEIKQAKADLESKKAEVEELISRQNAQKQDLADSQAEQQALLNQTQGQEDKYRELTDANNAKIEQLRKEQAEEIARRLAAANNSGSTIYYNNGASCGGGYPAYLCNAPKDSLVDPWGMYSRECVSYVAFKVASTYGWPNYWTRGGNNANQWPGKADRYGIPRGSTPKVGSVAVMMSGYYGHVAWVEEVHGNRIVVSDYNSDMRGNYARYETSASAFDTYIYFDQS